MISYETALNPKEAKDWHTNEYRSLFEVVHRIGIVLAESSTEKRLLCLELVIDLDTQV